MNDLGASGSFAASASDDDTRTVILAAREAITRNLAPFDNRYLAVSPEITSRMLLVPEFVKVNESGSTDALRNAIIGRIYGFTVVESAALDAGTAIAYHQSGFVFANRTPIAPRGAFDSAVATQGGIGMRQIFQYDPDILSDRSVVSTFAGASAVKDDLSGGSESTPSDELRFYKIDSAAS
jgi:hypothetical protein